MNNGNFCNISDVIPIIIDCYREGETYVEAAFINGHSFKVRMNKDHDMKHYNNEDSVHVLSIVYNTYRNRNSDYFLHHDGRYIQQVVQKERNAPFEQLDEYDEDYGIYYDENGQRIITDFEIEELTKKLTAFLEIVFEQEPIEVED
jgi:hypothetical protein